MIKIGDTTIYPISYSLNIHNNYRYQHFWDSIEIIPGCIHTELNFSYYSNQTSILNNLNSDIIYDNKSFKVIEANIQRSAGAPSLVNVRCILNPLQPKPKQNHPHTNIFCD
jgi:hypothetical protein